MYKALSKYYDLFMKDVNYSKLADFVCGFINEKKQGVDLACGSGLFTLELKKRGYDIFGVDISQDMLNRATQNASKSMQRVSFIKGDMANIQFHRPQEFATSICDGINYLKNPLIAFKNIYSQLKDNGVFVFDISSEFKLTNILADCTFSDTQDNTTYIWKSTLDKANKRLCYELTFFEKTGDLYNKSQELQEQYIHSTHTILSMLRQANFKAEAFALGNDQKAKKPTDTDERIYFVATK